MASPYSVNTIVLKCAMATLDDINYISEYIEEVIISRKKLIEGLRRLGYQVFDSEANFVVCRIGDDASRIARELETRGILVRDRSSYPLLEGCIRISAGTIADTQRVLETMADIRGEYV